MGLLDDAIREHLDLKRRRGADPSEVARLEHEALGPVRREPASAEGEAPAPEAAPAEPRTEASHADEPHEAADATRVLAPEDRHEPPHGDPLREQPPSAQGEEPAGSADVDRAGGAGEDDFATPLAESPRPVTGPARPAADPEPEPEDPRLSDIVHQPTTEFRVEDHHNDEDEHEASAAHAGPDEDVLEETPEFLQETPEHDRLWFEQRPPRDFDFDG
jgi:hypothetical protein